MERVVGGSMIKTQGIVMGLSSNSLIHFTDSLQNLFGIIESGFRAKYCKETFSLKSHEEETLHVPMVSFCDIPFSQIKDHIENYGCYGIGLSKEWAIRNRLNPVLYVQSQSAIAENYYSLMQCLQQKEWAGEIDKTPRRMGLEIVRHIKNYEGILRRNGTDRFSDEREWRYVPEESNKYAPCYTADEFAKRTAATANAMLDGLHLAFRPNDVSYIIISSDDEIQDFWAHLSTRDRFYTVHEKQLLITRVITNDQIQGDF